ncbi:hypothetical protein ACH5RR_031502 [Cinchona calisaya]|uniref:Uncharacterized protein n=1 Tax=Cinchona calisaya TaxID=153742 RepID=A0ABD2YFF3_9GENT
MAGPIGGSDDDADDPDDDLQANDGPYAGSGDIGALSANAPDSLDDGGCADFSGDIDGGLTSDGSGRADE